MKPFSNSSRQSRKNKIKTFQFLRVVLICILIGFGLCAGSVSASEQSTGVPELQEMSDGILTWRCSQVQAEDVQQLLDGFCTENVGSGVVQSYVMGMLQDKPELDFSTFTEALEESLTAPESYSEVSLQKAVLVSILLGRCDEQTYADCLRDTVGKKGIMSYVYGLMVVEAWQEAQPPDAGDGSEQEQRQPDAEDGSEQEPRQPDTADTADQEQAILMALLERRLPDGGYAVSGTEGDVDVTAMVLQAYAAYLNRQLPESDTGYQADGLDGQTDITLQEVQADGNVSTAEVRQMMAGSLEFLSERQLATGDYESYHNRNLESTAQVLLALDALQINADQASDFIKNGITLTEAISRYQLEDGSFCHTPEGRSDDMASAQAYQALVSHRRTIQEAEPDMQSSQNSADKTQEAEPDMKSRQDSVDETGSGINDGINKTDIPDYRIPVSCVILLFGSVYLIVCVIRKKQLKNRAAGCLLVMAVGILAVWKLQIQSVQDYYQPASGEELEAQKDQLRVTFSIRCDTVAGETEDIPADGILLADTDFYVDEGTTVFQILQTAVKQNSIQMEYEGTSDSYAYVEGIAYLYEFDYGELSGWMYLVNGQLPSVGCGGYQVQDQDEIIFAYTRDIGKDLTMYEENE